VVGYSLCEFEYFVSWFVYIVRCVDETLYTGVAKDVQARIEQHNKGLGAKYTRGRGPVSLVYCEQLSDQTQALRREMAIKRLSRASKLSLVATFQAGEDCCKP
jgi:putative endonuclease